MINEHRKTTGLKPLIYNETLAEIGRVHSRNMQKKVVPRGHEGCDQRYEAIFKRLGRQFSGENVAVVATTIDPLKNTVEVWLDSPLHKENIDEELFVMTGVGVVVDDLGILWITQMSKSGGVLPLLESETIEELYLTVGERMSDDVKRQINARHAQQWKRVSDLVRLEDRTIHFWKSAIHSILHGADQPVGSAILHQLATMGPSLFDALAAAPDWEYVQVIGEFLKTHLELEPQETARVPDLCFGLVGPYQSLHQDTGTLEVNDTMLHELLSIFIDAPLACYRAVCSIESSQLKQLTKNWRLQLNHYLELRGSSLHEQDITQLVKTWRELITSWKDTSDTANDLRHVINGLQGNLNSIFIHNPIDPFQLAGAKRGLLRLAQDACETTVRAAANKELSEQDKLVLFYGALLHPDFWALLIEEFQDWTAIPEVQP